MKNSVLYQYTFIIYCYTCKGYEFICPSAGHWHLKAKTLCHIPNQYTCLFDVSRGIYVDTCDGPRKEIKGQMTTINNNNFNTEDCPMDRFQPFDFSTFKTTSCIYQKSRCVEEGQLAIGHDISRSAIKDTPCGCDINQGFTFVSALNINKYSCTPSDNDCSCIRQDTGTWNISYKNFTSKSIKEQRDQEKGTFIKEQVGSGFDQPESSNKLAGLTVVVLMLTMFGVLCVPLVKKTDLLQNSILLRSRNQCQTDVRVALSTVDPENSEKINHSKVSYIKKDPDHEQIQETKSHFNSSGINVLNASNDCDELKNSVTDIYLSCENLHNVDNTKKEQEVKNKSRIEADMIQVKNSDKKKLENQDFEDNQDDLAPKKQLITENFGTHSNSSESNSSLKSSGNDKNEEDDSFFDCCEVNSNNEIHDDSHETEPNCNQSKDQGKQSEVQENEEKFEEMIREIDGGSQGNLIKNKEISTRKDLKKTAHTTDDDVTIMTKKCQNSCSDQTPQNPSSASDSQVMKNNTMCPAEIATDDESFNRKYYFEECSNESLEGRNNDNILEAQKVKDSLKWTYSKEYKGQDNDDFPEAQTTDVCSDGTNTDDISKEQTTDEFLQEINKEECSGKHKNESSENQGEEYLTKRNTNEYPDEQNITRT